MYALNGIALDNPQLGWLFRGPSKPLSDFVRTLTSLRTTGRDGFVELPDSTEGPTLPLMVQSPRGSLEALYALILSKPLTLSLATDPTREVTCQLVSTAQEGFGNADAVVDVTFVVRLNGVWWWDVVESTTGGVAVGSSTDVSVFAGISAPVRDALIRVSGAVAGLKVAGGEGSWFSYGQALPAGSYLRFDSDTGRAWVTGTDSWVGGVEVTGLIGNGPGAYPLSISPVLGGSEFVWVGDRDGSVSQERSVLSGDVLVVNEATYPSFETPSGTVTVRTNYLTNPNFESGTTGWNVANATFATTTAEHHSGTQSLQVVTDGTASAGAYSSRLPLTGWASTDDEIAGTWVKAPVGTLLYVQIANVGGGAPLTDFTGTGDWQFVASPTQKVGAATSGSYILIRAQHTGSPITFYVDDAGIEKSTVLKDTFNSTTPAAGDFSYALAGDGTSIQTAPGVAGINANTISPFQSREWFKNGSKSLRVRPGGNDSRARIIDGSQPNLLAGKTYTVISTLRFVSALSAISDASISSATNGTGVLYVSTYSPSTSPGEYELRHTFSIPSDATAWNLNLYNSSPAGNGDVWWDDLMIVEVPDVDHPYTGPYFDGNTPPMLDPTVRAGVLTVTTTTSDGAQIQVRGKGAYVFAEM